MENDWNKMAKGAIFCQVNKINPGSNGMPCSTSGTQKWKGANPSFIIREIVSMNDAIWFWCCTIAH